MELKTKAKILGRTFDIMFTLLIMVVFTMSYLALQWLGVVITIVVVLATFITYASYVTARKNLIEKKMHALLEESLKQLSRSLEASSKAHEFNIHEHADGEIPLH